MIQLELNQNIKQIFSQCDHLVIPANATLELDINQNKYKLIAEPIANLFFNEYPKILANCATAIANNNQFIAGNNGQYRCYYPYGLIYSKNKLVLLQCRDWHYSAYDNAIHHWSILMLKKYANDYSDKRIDILISAEWVSWYKILPQNCYCYLI